MICMQLLKLRVNCNVSAWSLFFPSFFQLFSFASKIKVNATTLKIKDDKQFQLNRFYSLSTSFKFSIQKLKLKLEFCLFLLVFISSFHFFPLTNRKKKKNFRFIFRIKKSSTNVVTIIILKFMFIVFFPVLEIMIRRGEKGNMKSQQRRWRWVPSTKYLIFFKELNEKLINKSINHKFTECVNF